MTKKDKRFFSKKEEKKIIKAIVKAEKKTSGEIRVHIESQPSEDHFARAIEVFNKLEMEKTKDRNGVLFHLSPSAKNLTIIGDQGINEKTPEGFWDEINETVLHYFRREKFTRGIIKGIKMTGKALKKYFPHQENDENELPNEISQN